MDNSKTAVSNNVSNPADTDQAHVRAGILALMQRDVVEETISSLIEDQIIQSVPCANDPNGPALLFEGPNYDADKHGGILGFLLGSEDGQHYLPAKPPTKEVMQKLYEVAAQLAVIEQWDILTEHRMDHNAYTIDDLLDDAADIFAEQSEHRGADMRRADQLRTLEESAFFDELCGLKKEAIKRLILFAEQHIVLSWNWPGDMWMMRTLHAWARAAMAVA